MSRIVNWRHERGLSMDYIDEMEAYYKEHWAGFINLHSVEGESLEDWFISQGAVEGKDYDAPMRFNSGNPGYTIAIYKEWLASAFYLRWS